MVSILLHPLDLWHLLTFTTIVKKLMLNLKETGAGEATLPPNPNLKIEISLTLMRVKNYFFYSPSRSEWNVKDKILFKR
jgi:hypothetical protein